MEERREPAYWHPSYNRTMDIGSNPILASTQLSSTTRSSTELSSTTWSSTARASTGLGFLTIILL